MLLRVKRGAIRSVLPWRPTLTKSVVGRNAALKINSVDFTAQRALYTSRYVHIDDNLAFSLDFVALTWSAA
jgi:hypothetical protein